MVLNVHRRRDQRRTLNKKIRVYLNGYDVTARCTKLDGRRRRCWLFNVDDQGQLILDPILDEVVGRWHFGRVKVKFNVRGKPKVRSRYPGEPAQHLWHANQLPRPTYTKYTRLRRRGVRFRHTTIAYSA